MKCVLCNKEIEKYNLELNHLKIDENKSVEICSVCVDRFIKWQQTLYARLFPTTTAKKFFKEK